jgi:CBS domain containing-hemolysin-like protein
MTEILLFLVCLICIRLKKSYCELAEDKPQVRQTGHRSIHIVLEHKSFMNIMFDSAALLVFTFFALSAASDYETASAIAVILSGLALIFDLLPKLRPFSFEKRLAAASAPLPAYFIKRLENHISRIENLSARLGQRSDPPRAISRHELSELLRRQHKMADEEMKTDINLALIGLELNRQEASKLMIRKQKLRSVKLDDEVGPVLLSELHKTGRRTFPVKDGPEIAGTVRLDKLTELKAGGKVEDALDPQMIAINKDEPKLSVIRRFVESGAQLVFTEDDEGKIAGAIYLEDVLQELIEN